MTKDKKNEKDKNDNSDYPVGYKKPPRHAQFKPGQSGNSKGRPKRSPTFEEALTKQLRRSVTVTMGDRVEKIPMLEAIAIKLVSQAASGDPKSTAIVRDSLKSSENDEGHKFPELLQQFRSIYASRKEGENECVRSVSTEADNKN
jgi:hypothetical protein